MQLGRDGYFALFIESSLSESNLHFARQSWKSTNHTGVFTACPILIALVTDFTTNAFESMEMWKCGPSSPICLTICLSLLLSTILSSRFMAASPPPSTPSIRSVNLNVFKKFLMKEVCVIWCGRIPMKLLVGDPLLEALAIPLAGMWVINLITITIFVLLLVHINLLWRYRCWWWDG